MAANSCSTLNQQVLDAGQLRLLDPALAEAPFIGGVFTPDEEVADCHRFCLRLAERLQASGQCRLHLGQAVTRLIRRKDEVVALALG
jgi:D-amino-acid dehydrogenase